MPSSLRRAGGSRPGLHLGAVPTDPIYLGAHDQPLFSWPAERLLVSAKKALGELVDVVVGPGLGDGRLAVEHHG